MFSHFLRFAFPISAVQCPVLNVSEGMNLSSFLFEFPNVVTLTCEAGFKLVSINSSQVLLTSVHFECTYTAKWSDGFNSYQCQRKT